MYLRTNGLGQGFFDKITQSVEEIARSAGAAAGTAQSVAQNPLKIAVDSVTAYSAYSAPVSYTADQIVTAYRAPAGPPGIMDRIKPTLVINSPILGRKIFAPYGIAKPDEYKTNQRNLLLLVLGGATLLVVGSAYVGYKLGRRKSRRSK